MITRARQWRRKMLAAVCFIVAADIVDADGSALAAVQASSASTRSASSCSLLGLKPTNTLELHRIVARHFGFQMRFRHLFQMIDLGFRVSESGNSGEAYLDQLKPRYANWRREAQGHPEKADLSEAFLAGEDLSGANLSESNLSCALLAKANLSGANLSYANLSGATSIRANLRGADLIGAKLDEVELDGADLRAADLRRASLRGASLVDGILSGADLKGADLSGAFLRQVDLSHADLAGVDLSRLDLRGAKLTATNLSDTNLDGADLNGATLNGANLTGANLTGADLRGANLSDARLRFVRVNKARLGGANLTGAMYAPDSEPPDSYVAGIEGLDTLRLSVNEDIGLVQLRKLLQDAGLRDDERAATYSIERNVTRDRLSSSFWSFAWIEGIGRFIGFDVTTAYGLHPTYALGWILLLAAVLTPVYMRAMLHPTAMSGILQVFPADRLDGTDGDTAEEKERKKTVVRAKSWQSSIPSAAYFSLISALNIGFEQFTPGDWLRRLQAREYSLEAVGWVRVVAGGQALLSVYLLALWALTQFGRPFE